MTDRSLNSSFWSEPQDGLQESALKAQSSRIGGACGQLPTTHLMRDTTLKGRVEGAAEPGGLRAQVRVRQEELGKGVQSPWEFC